MCAVCVKVDETVLRNMMPELDSPAAISQWAQQQIGMLMQETIAQGDTTMSIEDALWMTLQAVREEYAR